MIQLSPFNPLPGGVFKKFVLPVPDGTCEGCGIPMAVRGKGIKIPGLRGVYCSTPCLETGLFGHQACRWCGEMMEKTYSSLDSRLCSDDCGLNYRSHALGDHTAALGTGQRFIKWLQKNRPAIYRELVSANVGIVMGYCQNPSCPNGEDGKPASLAHLRAGTRFCCESCKKQAQRSPNPQNRASKTPVFIGLSRDTSEDMDLGA
jgi:hypothetical protein